MDARIGLADPVAARAVRHLVSADRAVSKASLPASTLELVKLRANQINGCGFCRPPARRRPGGDGWSLPAASPSLVCQAAAVGLVQAALHLEGGEHIARYFVDLSERAPASVICSNESERLPPV